MIKFLIGLIFGLVLAFNISPELKTIIDNYISLFRQFIE